MPSNNTNVESSVEGLFDAKPGTVIRDRYKILSLQSSSRQGPFIWFHSTFVALDTK